MYSEKGRLGKPYYGTMAPRDLTGWIVGLDIGHRTVSEVDTIARGTVLPGWIVASGVMKKLTGTVLARRLLVAGVTGCAYVVEHNGHRREVPGCRS